MSSILKSSVILFSLFTFSSAFANTPFEPFVGRYEVVKSLKNEVVLEFGDSVVIQSFRDSATLDIKNSKTAAHSYSVNMTEYEIYQGEGHWDVATFITEADHIGWAGQGKQIFLYPLPDGSLKIELLKHAWGSLYWSDEALLIRR